MTGRFGKKMACLIAMFVVLACSMVGLSNAYAAEVEDVYKKVLVNNFVDKCYGGLVDSFTEKKYRELAYYGVNGVESLLFGDDNGTEPDIYVPSIRSLNSNMSKYEINCRILLGGGTFSMDGKTGGYGLFDIYNTTIPQKNSSTADISTFADAMGYTGVSSSSGVSEYCYRVSFNTNHENGVPQIKELGSFCINSDEYRDNDRYKPSSLNLIRIEPNENGEELLSYSGCKQKSDKSSKSPCSSYPIKYEGNEIFSIKDLSSPPRDGEELTGGNGATTIKISARSGGDTTYSKDKGAGYAIGKITGGGYNGKAEVTDAEKYVLYVQYLTDNFVEDGGSVASSTCQATKPNPIVDEASVKYYIYMAGQGWCLANLNKNKVAYERPVLNVFKENNYVMNGTVNTAKELVELLGKLDYDKIKDDIPSITEAERPEGQWERPQSNSVNDKDVCFSSSGSLGWILCPIMNKLSDTIGNVYEESVEPFLEIKASLLSNDNATKKVWDRMITFANILIVILLLIVIFSQLTGVGIDNYNIKKILPKIIVVTILVNLSYFICQLAVDVSNIVGNSINDLLQGMAPNPGDLMPKWNGQSMLKEKVASSGGNAAWFKTLVNVAGVGLIGTGIATVSIAFLSHTVLSALVLPVLLLLITALFAVMFFFVLMGLRQAGVVILVILAPVAIACYMLPNTKKYFDKWKKMFTGLLLLYPICGLVVGGGELTSKLLVRTSQDYLMYFVACIMMVAPFFLIPTLLKGSFAAMGNIGAKVSGLGKRVGSVATGKARNSEAYKRAQERGVEKKAIWRGGLKRRTDGSYEEKKVGAFGRMMRGGKRSMADSRTQAIAAREKRQRMDSMMGAGFGAASIAQSKKFDSEEVGNYMTLVNDKTRNGEDEEILFELYDKYMEDGNKAGAVAVARIAGRRKDTAARFMAEKFNDISKNNPEMAQSIAKEVATGENSRTYMESTPLQFEYAAQLNRAKYNSDTGVFEYKYDTGRKDKNGKPIMDTKIIPKQYKTTTKEMVDGKEVERIDGGWVHDGDNIHDALQKYVTDSRQLAGMKGSALRELNGLIESGVVSKTDAAKLNTLATEMIDNRDKMPLDYTKGAEYAALTGGVYTFDDKTQKFIRNGGSVAASGPEVEGLPISPIGDGAGGGGGAVDGRPIVEGLPIPIPTIGAPGGGGSDSDSTSVDSGRIIVDSGVPLVVGGGGGANPVLNIDHSARGASGVATVAPTAVSQPVIEQLSVPHETGSEKIIRDREIEIEDKYHVKVKAVPMGSYEAPGSETWVTNYEFQPAETISVPAGATGRAEINAKIEQYRELFGKEYEAVRTGNSGANGDIEYSFRLKPVVHSQPASTERIYNNDYDESFTSTIRPQGEGDTLQVRRNTENGRSNNRQNDRRDNSNREHTSEL